MFAAFFSLIVLQVVAGSDRLVTVVDLLVGETQRVELHDGTSADVTLLDVTDRRDSVMGAVREILCTVEVNGEKATITNVNYNLPIPAGGVQVDCPAAQALMESSTADSWGLEKDARIRLWPAESPYIRSGTFVYPMKQKWFASATWYSNEPVSKRDDGRIYYHDGMDIGAAEGLDAVVSAVDGLVVSVGEDVHPSAEQPPVNERYDVVYIRDARGWYYRYSHLDMIQTAVQVGDSISAGQSIGRAGKEGHSGGWSHLHFEIKSRQPSGNWGTQDSYAFLWQAYHDEYEPDIIAVARPRHHVRPGEQVVLDGSRSWSAAGDVRHEWILSDGRRIDGPVAEITYVEPGSYSEILKVTDAEGRVDYDFAGVRVREEVSGSPPTPHLAYHPTLEVRAGNEITFKVRTRTDAAGEEIWDFGDGSPPQRTASNRNTHPRAPDGYAVINHTYAEPGDYIVTVRRSNEFGTGTDRVHIKVE